METKTQSKSSINTPTAIIVAGIIIAGAVLWSAGKGASPPSPTGTQQAPPAQAVNASTVETAGEPFIGNANASLTMAYWYDYQCPFCQRNEQSAMPQIIKEYVDTGKLKVVFKDYQFLGPDSQTLGRYSQAVWEAAPDQFYQWHKAIYDNQGAENAGWATEEKIRAITTQVLDANLANQIADLVKAKGDEYQKEMDDDKAEGAAMGIAGTPGTIVGTQLVSGAQPYAVFKAAIDAALTNQ